MAFSRLAARDTKECVGNHDLRTGLRRLRSMGLIENASDKGIGKMADKLFLDMADYVRLTAFGERWVETLKTLDDPKADASDE